MLTSGSAYTNIIASDRLLLLVQQVSWWLWSICVWTDTTSASLRPRAAARLWRPPAPPWAPQAPWTLCRACSTAAPATLQASHENSFLFNRSPLCPPSMTAPVCCYSFTAFLKRGRLQSVVSGELFFFIMGSQEKLLSSAVFVFQ